MENKTYFYDKKSLFYVFLSIKKHIFQTISIQLSGWRHEISQMTDAKTNKCLCFISLIIRLIRNKISINYQSTKKYLNKNMYLYNQIETN